jgi:hypothetical protein
MKESLVKYELKELNRALNLAIAGLFGALIPIIGLTLGIIALTSSLSVKTSNNLAKSKRKIAIAVAVFAMVLSLFVGVGFFIAYRHNQRIEQDKINQIQKVKDEKSQKSKSVSDAEDMRKKRAQSGLNNCLSAAYSSYRSGWDAEAKRLGRIDGSLPQANVDLAESRYKSDKDECYRKFNAGLFDNYIPIL